MQALGMNEEQLKIYHSELSPELRGGIVGILVTMTLMIISAGVGLALAATPAAPLVPSIETGLMSESVIIGESAGALATNLIIMG